MTKEKIAISLSPGTVEMVDAMVDGLTLRSRSQAIEYLVHQGITQRAVKEAVILIRDEDAPLLLQDVEGKTLLAHHLDWLAQYGIELVYLVTSQNLYLKSIEQQAKKRLPRLQIVLEEKPSGTMGALNLLKETMTGNFIVMLGDTLNRFDLGKMIRFHLNHGKLATIGLISSPHPENYSSVELEGDRIVEFRREDSQSHIIDAGIYLFKPAIFSHFSPGKKFFERDVFPSLCHTDEIKGYFTHGKYVHLGEEEQ